MVNKFFIVKFPVNLSGKKLNVEMSFWTSDEQYIMGARTTVDSISAELVVNKSRSFEIENISCHPLYEASQCRILDTFCPRHIIDIKKCMRMVKKFSTTDLSVNRYNLHQCNIDQYEQLH